MWIQLPWQLSLSPPPGDLPLSAALGLVCPGGLRAGTRTSYVFGHVSPSSTASQVSGASGAGSVMPLVWPNEAPAAAGVRLALWTGSLGSDNFLVKSTCYFLSRVPIPSWAIPDLPFQFISFPFPHVESTYRSVKVSGRVLKPQTCLHNALSTCSAEPADLSFCLLREAGFFTEEPTSITLNLKRTGQES